MANPSQGPGPISDPLFVAIHGVHDAIAQEQDPADKAQLGQCLTIMLKIQAKNHQQAAQGGPAQALLGRVGGQ